MILWRAANDDYISDAASFAETREVAEAYLDNRGFGGSNLYRADVSPRDVLDLTSDGLATLMSVLDRDSDWGAIGVDELVPRLASQLCDRGYQWAKVCESYPQYTTTWIYIGGGCGDEPTLELAQ